MLTIGNFETVKERPKLKNEPKVFNYINYYYECFKPITVFLYANLFFYCAKYFTANMNGIESRMIKIPITNGNTVRCYVQT